MKFIEKDVYSRIDHDVTTKQKKLIRQMIQSSALDDWEINFLKNALYFIKFSKKQKEILNRIYKKTKSWNCTTSYPEFN